MTNSNTLLKLLHLADSALPVGGYAYSNGLEYTLKSGFVSSVEELESYLTNFVNQFKNYDLTFVKASYNCNDKEELQNISDYYEASLLNPPVKKAGLILGKNWVRLLQQIYPELSNIKIDYYDYPIVFGSLSAQLGLSITETCYLYAFMAIRDQVSAVIRLGTLGPTHAHQIQYKLLEEIEDTAFAEHIPHYKEAYKTAYLLESMQLSHKTLYTKLFQN